MQIEGYIAESTERSGVPVKVGDPRVLAEIGSLISS